MLFKTRTNALEIDGRRSFAALMELYETNYIFMRRLVPDLDRAEDITVSRVAGTPDLHLMVDERCAYTTSVLLTHCFSTDGAREMAPALKVRVYHDARVAEVLPESRLAGFSWWRNQAPPQPATLAWRWEVNRFLNRWLRYCLGEGHAFTGNRGLDPAPRPLARRWA